MLSAYSEALVTTLFPIRCRSRHDSPIRVSQFISADALKYIGYSCIDMTIRRLQVSIRKASACFIHVVRITSALTYLRLFSWRRNLVAIKACSDLFYNRFTCGSLNRSLFADKRKQLFTRAPIRIGVFIHQVIIRLGSRIAPIRGVART